MTSDPTRPGGIPLGKPQRAGSPGPEVALGPWVARSFPLFAFASGPGVLAVVCAVVGTPAWVVYGLAAVSVVALALYQVRARRWPGHDAPAQPGLAPDPAQRRPTPGPVIPVRVLGLAGFVLPVLAVAGQATGLFTAG